MNKNKELSCFKQQDNSFSFIGFQVRLTSFCRTTVLLAATKPYIHLQIVFILKNKHISCTALSVAVSWRVNIFVIIILAECAAEAVVLLRLLRIS